MLTRYHILERRVVEAQDEAAPVSVYVAPDDLEVRHLVDTVGIDEHTLRSALDPDELPRLELAPSHVALILKRPLSYTPSASLSFKVSSAGIFLFPARLVLVLPEDVPLFDSAQQLRLCTPAALLVHVLHRFITHFREHLKVISLIADELEGELPQAASSKALVSAFTLTKSLVHYQDALAADVDVLRELARHAARVGLSADEVALLEDAIIESLQCHNQAAGHGVMLRRLLEARAAIVAHRVEVRLQTLTRAFVALTVPALVLGLFSTRLATPFLDEPWGLGMVLGLAIISAVGVLVAWPRRP